jgi:hypothetical protein
MGLGFENQGLGAWRIRERVQVTGLRVRETGLRVRETGLRVRESGLGGLENQGKGSRNRA